jgi:hypothetical protein
MFCIWLEGFRRVRRELMEDFEDVKSKLLLVG